MTPPSHAKNTRTPGLGAAWAVLIGTGATSVTFNVVHAVHWLQLALALLAGFMPSFVAACLSHVAAVLDAPKWVIGAVIAVMGAGMVLSASATASVIAPADPGWRGWLFGITLDAAALLALWAIMASRRRKNEAAEAVETARAEAREATAQAQAARTELASVRAALGAEVERLTAELEAELKRAANRKPPRKSRRTSARKPARASAPEVPVTSGAEDADEVSAEARALSLWMDSGKTIPGTKLGPMVGVSDSMGRTWVRNWKQAVPEGTAASNGHGQSEG